MLVLAHLGMEVEPAPVPSALTIVSSRMVARVIERDGSSGAIPGAQSVQQQTGPFGLSVTYAQGVTSGGPWLTAADKVMLKPHKVGGMAAVAIATGRTGSYRTEV